KEPLSSPLNRRWVGPFSHIALLWTAHAQRFLLLPNLGITVDAGDPLRFRVGVSMLYFARGQISGDYFQLILALHQRPCVARRPFAVRGLISGGFANLDDMEDSQHSSLSRFFPLRTGVLILAGIWLPTAKQSFRGICSRH